MSMCLALLRTWTQEHSLASHPHTHAHHVHTGAFARAHTHTLTHSLTHRTKATAREWRVGATATSCGCARRATPPSAALAVRSPRKFNDLRGCRIIFLATCGSIAPASGRAGIIRFLFRIRFICWRTCASPARCRDFFAPVAFQGFGFTLERRGEWPDFSFHGSLASRRCCRSKNRECILGASRSQSFSTTQARSS